MTVRSVGKPLSEFFSEWRRQLTATHFGRATRSTIEVGLALCRMAEGLGCDFVRPGQLSLAVAAGRSQATVSAALRRLSRARLVRRTNTGSRAKLSADTWRLCLPQSAESVPSSDGWTVLDESAVWSNYALGGTCRKVMAALLTRPGEPMTTAEVARLSGLSVREVRRHLATLHRYDFVHAPRRVRKVSARAWTEDEWRDDVLIRLWTDLAVSGDIAGRSDAVKAQRAAAREALAGHEEWRQSNLENAVRRYRNRREETGEREREALSA